MNYPAPSPLRQEDYEAIEAAVMETERGRWFLSEFARRNRSTDTGRVLEVLDRLETLLKARAAQPALPPPQAPQPPIQPVLDVITREIVQIERGMSSARADLSRIEGMIKAKPEPAPVVVPPVVVPESVTNGMAAMERALAATRTDLARLETLVRMKAQRAEPAPTPAPVVKPTVPDEIRQGIADIERELATARMEMARLAREADAGGRILHASEDLETVVAATEQATQEILAAAERIQETAWTLRESGADGAACDALDALATEIYLACSFQDLTGQRIARVVKTMSFVQDRIGSFVETLGIEPTPIAPEPDEPVPSAPRASGPARAGEGVDQARVDGLMDEDDLFEPAPRADNQNAAAVPPSEPVAKPERLPVPAAATAPAPRTHGALALAPEPVHEPAPEPQAVPQPKPRPDARAVPEVDFAELAFAEKVALFS